MKNKLESEWVFDDGWLQSIEHCPSPNFNARPDEKDIDLIVVHSISLPPGEYGNSFVKDFFCNKLDVEFHPYFQEIKSLKVSSHFFISRAGDICQFVSINDRAWHAGRSEFEGRLECNDFSIGIELEGLEGESFEKVQYQQLGNLCCSLMKILPKINHSRIAGHSDIAPGRKQDPGSGFDWDYLKTLLKTV